MFNEGTNNYNSQLLNSNKRNANIYEFSKSDKMFWVTVTQTSNKFDNDYTELMNLWENIEKFLLKLK